MRPVVKLLNALCRKLLKQISALYHVTRNSSKFEIRHIFERESKKPYRKNWNSKNTYIHISSVVAIHWRHVHMLIFRDIRRQYIRRYFLLLLLLLLSFTKTDKHFEGESKKPNRKHETQNHLPPHFLCCGLLLETWSRDHYLDISGVTMT